MFQHLNCTRWAAIPVTDRMADRNTNKLPYAFAAHAHRGINIASVVIPKGTPYRSLVSWENAHEPQLHDVNSGSILSTAEPRQGCSFSAWQWTHPPPITLYKWVESIVTTMAKKPSAIYDKLHVQYRSVQRFSSYNFTPPPLADAQAGLMWHL